MKIHAEKDIIVALVDGDLEGIELPASLEHTLLEYLRYNPQTQEVIDLRQLSQPYQFYIDEKGIKHILQLNPDWQPLECNWDDELINDNETWRIKTQEEKLQEIKQKKQEELLSFEKQRVQKILDSYGYISLADVQFYANQTIPDQEAVALLDWYQAYDDLIWSYIDNDLAAFTTVDELLQVDMKNIEQQIYEQSIQTSPLP